MGELDFFSIQAPNTSLPSRSFRLRRMSNCIFTDKAGVQTTMGWTLPSHSFRSTAFELPIEGSQIRRMVLDS
jgi:hypothetical protein